MRGRFVIVLATACGGTPAPEQVPAGGAAISLVAPRAAETDVLVAEVNGRPVWGSCVSAQLARGASTREAALAECVDFELLAQAAEERGLATDPEVLAETRTAMVSELVAHEFEDRYRNPGDLGARLEKVLTQNAWRMHRPDLRTSTYVRIDVPKDAPADLDRRARELAERIASELAEQRGLLGPHLVAAAERLAEGTGLAIAHADVKLSPRGRLDPSYGDALFELPEVGRSSRAVRTPWGWDVVLWTGGLPPLERSRDELAAEVFPELRRQMFQVWVDGIVKDHGVTIAIDEQQVARLDEVTP